MTLAAMYVQVLQQMHQTTEVSGARWSQHRSTCHAHRAHPTRMLWSWNGSALFWLQTVRSVASDVVKNTLAEAVCLPQATRIAPA